MRSPKSSPRIMWEGPADTLTLTHNAQPALLAVSIAALRVLEAEGGPRSGARCCVRGRPFAGGIFSAHGRRCFAACDDAARLVRLRGQAMQKAVPVGVGAMAALLGLEFEMRSSPWRTSRGGADLSGRQ